MNVKDASGLTPLLAAVSNDKPATAMALIRKGGAVHVTDASRQSCLHLASAQGSSELVSMLLRFGALNLRNVEQKTALYLAAEHGHHECLEMLAAAGANVEIQATDGGTPLLVATEAQSEPCVDALLKHGADPNVECREYWPPLAIHAAAVGENFNILRRLAAVTRRGLGSGEGEVSPVFLALEKPEMLEVLLKEGFSLEAGWENSECLDDYGADSPLGQVLYHMVDDPALNHSRCMSLLMRAGAPLTEECWRLSLMDPCVLELLLAQRCENQGKGPGARPLLSGEELEAIVSAAEEDATEAGSWPCWRAGWTPTLCWCLPCKTSSTSLHQRTRGSSLQRGFLILSRAVLLHDGKRLFSLGPDGPIFNDSNDSYSVKLYLKKFTNKGQLKPQLVLNLEQEQGAHFLPHRDGWCSLRCKASSTSAAAIFVVVVENAYKATFCIVIVLSRLILDKRL
ncbi:ankyrin repeat and SOCS box protein 3-like [Gadus macrocephalus]|uniref:ankyrin repeat and SOCS box protein 3-like n=1 Tax=Gadus macrocephalus TaxID=80720 RepID=UPI0028CB9934|nr:ankyrin repeat and SOCS box protein 3-like [Gadus macrocephalus]